MHPSLPLFFKAKEEQNLIYIATAHPIIRQQNAITVEILDPQC